jgi:hypothetical protein
MKSLIIIFGFLIGTQALAVNSIECGVYKHRVATEDCDQQCVEIEGPFHNQMAYSLDHDRNMNISYVDWDLAYYVTVTPRKTYLEISTTDTHPKVAKELISNFEGTYSAFLRVKSDYSPGSLVALELRCEGKNY